MKTEIFLFFLIVWSGLLGAQTITIQEGSITYVDVKDSTVNMSGTCELHLTGEDPIDGATINIEGTEAWLFIHGEQPSYLIDRLSQITVNGVTAVDDDNVRVHQYEMGVVLIPHDDTYAGATLFEEADLGGDSLNVQHYTIYKGEDGLGTMNNAMSSFVLRKGYMMTIAQETTGMGYSQNYVADTVDIIVDQLSEALDDKVSFVRVTRWNWPTKKGINSVYVGDSVNASWYYNWGSGSESLDDMEYVPMKWSGGDVSENNFIYKKNITHQLAFNEPDGSDQADMEVEDALRQYPKLLATGLRAGSPATTDGGLSWLYEFMEKADSLNYRVDFVAVHWYKGCNTATQFYNWLKTVHENTGRPIWITEFNNGASWTADECIPTFDEQAETIASFLNMFDTCSFVERYCIYNWGEETRKLALLDDDKMVDSLYPSGIVYRDQESPFAYDESQYFTPVYTPIPAPIDISYSTSDDDDVTLLWYENAYQEDGFSVERSYEDGAYEVIGTVDGEQSYEVSYIDDTRSEYGTYKYRVRTVKDGEYSAYSDVVSTLLDDGVYDICYIKHNESGMFLGANGYDLEMMDSTETGTNVQWVTIPADDGYYFIYNLENSYRLYNNSGDPVLDGGTTWNGDNYQWELEDAGDDYYLLQNKSLGELLWTKSADLTTIAFVATSWSGTKSQWKFVDTGVDYSEYTSVFELDDQSFSVSPIPCENTLTISGLTNETIVKVLDMSGKVLLQTQIQSFLDVSMLDQGIYFLQIENAQIVKFIKK
jgi:hypothetical protein